MSGLKYGDENVVTGRIGVYEMVRNIGFKINVPIDFKKQGGIIFLNGKPEIFGLPIFILFFEIKKSLPNKGASCHTRLVTCSNAGNLKTLGKQSTYPLL